MSLLRISQLTRGRSLARFLICCSTAAAFCDEPDRLPAADSLLHSLPLFGFVTLAAAAAALAVRMVRRWR